MTEQEALDIAVKAVDLYAARHPRPSHVTITQAAAMLGRSRQTVSKTLIANGIRINALGAVPIEAIDRLLASRND
ncbi:DNA-binding protein [Caballeronia sp. ATUFL_M2_KS44]|uniref:DNA-binding protein n=1 Tax=Caballeronia sp. ATUFL_M2_KS44 TaxID=2921767 RepID=UPI0020283B31|nr:DNA-binding protein [Caballeronia sp. ATUFL_M2_KS44]